MRSLIALAAVLATCTACAEPRPFTPGGALADTPADTPPRTAAGTAAPSGSPSGSVGSSASGGGRVDTVTVGPGLTVTIEWPARESAGRTAMLKALTDYIVGVRRAVAGDTTTDYRTLVQDDASRHALAWVDTFRRDGHSLQGHIRIYRPAVKAVVGAGAEVSACVDESGAELIDARTRKALPDQPAWTRSPDGIYAQMAGVRRGDDGVWRVISLQHAQQPQDPAKECLQ
ncbi:hypothetical protein [Sinosporangium album]|nr:hypothetical protein [Sinosporangium album]